MNKKLVSTLLLVAGVIAGLHSLIAQKQVTGLLVYDHDRTCPGYTLFAPKHNVMTYLMANDGRMLHSWRSRHEPGQSVYLLPNSHLLHTCFIKQGGMIGGGEGGRIEEFDWEGNIVWEFNYASSNYLMHHDIEPLPDGNILALVVEKKSRADCVAAGMNPDMLRERQLFPDYVIEIQPTGSKGGKIVWQWHVWDHLIQNFDRSKPDYGNPAAHPELVDPHGSGRGLPAFWNHMNSIDYNPELDQVMLSVRGNSEFWVIDHSTTTREAAGHSSGKSGKGGDLLYRWGNPQTYRTGTSRDQQLFQQHDAQWIEPGSPGAGHVLIFNNGLRRPDGEYSSVDEIVPPVDANGKYALAPGAAYGPKRPVWVYKAPKPRDMYAEAISGAQRLPNGNTLICDGTSGVFIEVTPAGDTVWKFVNPVVRTGVLAPGETPGKDHRGHNWNAVFKIHRYPLDYPGFTGKDLSERRPIEAPPNPNPQPPNQPPGRDRRARGQAGGRQATNSPPQAGARQDRQDRQARQARASKPDRGFVLVSGGEFEMGDHHNLGGREHRNDEVPVHTVRLDSFFMETTGVTLSQYVEFLKSALKQGLI